MDGSIDCFGSTWTSNIMSELIQASLSKIELTVSSFKDMPTSYTNALSKLWAGYAAGKIISSIIVKHSICTIACRCITNCAALQNAYVPTASRQKNACRTCTAPSVTPSRPQRIPHEANQEYCMYQVDQRTAQAPNAAILHLLPALTKRNDRTYQSARPMALHQGYQTYRIIPHQPHQQHEPQRTNRTNRTISNAPSVPHIPYQPHQPTLPTAPTNCTNRTKTVPYHIFLQSCFAL